MRYFSIIKGKMEELLGFDPKDLTPTFYIYYTNKLRGYPAKRAVERNTFKYFSEQDLKDKNMTMYLI